VQTNIFIVTSYFMFRGPQCLKILSGRVVGVHVGHIWPMAYDDRYDVTRLARHAVSAARPPRVRRPAGPTAGSVTDDNRRQPAKQYWPIRRVGNNV